MYGQSGRALALALTPATGSAKFASLNISHLEELEPVSEANGELLGRQSPVRNRGRPLTRYSLVSQINELHEGIIVGEYALVLRNLPELPVVAFHGIGCIDNPTDWLRVLEVGTEVLPFVSP